MRFRCAHVIFDTLFLCVRSWPTGPAGSQGSQLRDQLAALGLELPLLGSDDDTADRAYIQAFGLESYRAMGRRYGCDYAERFLYIGEGESAKLIDNKSIATIYPQKMQDAISPATVLSDLVAAYMG